MATIDFDLKKKQEIRSINIQFSGDVSNANYIKLYVDDKLVAEGEQPCFGRLFNKTWFIKPTEGKTIRYETVDKPITQNWDAVDRLGYKPSKGNATWSQLAEISVNGPYRSNTNKGRIIERQDWSKPGGVSKTGTGIFSNVDLYGPLPGMDDRSNF